MQDPKKVAKNRHLGTIAQMQDPKSRHLCTSHNFVGLYLRNQGMYRQWKKKLVKQQYVLHMSPQYGELRPTGS